MKKYLKYVIGISLIVAALILKSLLNHNIKYWELVKYSTILLSILGILVLLFSVWNNIREKPKKAFQKLPKEWLVYYLTNGTVLILALVAIIGIEKLGESLNFKLREYYLSQDTAKTTGILEDYIRFYLPKAEDEDFYLISFNIENQIFKKGLLVKYREKDGSYYNGKIMLENNKLRVENMIGSKIEIEYSKKFPSFLKIIK